MATGPNYFDTLYAKLNAAQKDAVDTIEGPVMVIAGPGTGKTTILTLRIANILKRTDTPAHGILAITYTDAGVRAIRAKLKEIIGNRAHDVHIHTFHSFASAMMAEYPDHFMHIDGMKSMTEIEQESLVRDIIADPKFADLRPSGRPDAYISGIMRSVDDAKREAMTPDLVRKHATGEIKKIQDDESSISSRGSSKGKLKADALEAIAKCERTLLFADIYEQYEEKKRASLRLDFNDLIIEFLLALRKDELLLRLIQERFLYIHVDEHQDTNDAQNFIIAHIAEFFETPNIFIVGDEKQAIYRFQGASVENFFLLRKRWPDMKVISLDVNYRSHQSILDAAWTMIEKNYEGEEHADLRVRLKSGNKSEQKPIDIVSAGDVRAAEDHLVHELRRIARDEPSATAAIIVRRNRDLDRIIRLLESAGVPVSSERSVDIFKHPIGRLFFDLIGFVADPSRIDSLCRTIVAGMWGKDFDEADMIVRDLGSGMEKNLERRLPGLKKIRHALSQDHAMGFVVHAADHAGYSSLVARDPAYVHVWRGIIALAESIVRDQKISDPSALIDALLAYRASAESKPIKVAVGAPDLAFKAMTAHGSKGLEFDYVFIPFATEEAWVGRARGGSFALPKKRAVTSDIADLRRLFYVAITRARRHVVITVPAEESDGRMYMPLRFVSELDPEHVRHSSLPSMSTSVAVPSTTAVTESDNFLAFTKKTLRENGLSVTALNHYIECPNKFLYLSVLKLPQAPSISSEKGSAMHHAIANIWKEHAKDVDQIKRLLEEGIDGYIADSFLPAKDKERALRELKENAPAVARELAPHFGEKGTILVEHWVKCHMDLKFMDEAISLPIHGKLDAILDAGHVVRVFDYKTSQATSLADIRGETKSAAQTSRGKYFRQLIFYRILLGEDARWRGRRIEPALVYVTPDKKDRCPIISIPIETTDIERVKKEIQSLIDVVWSGAITGATCADPGCEWCGLRNISAA